MQLPAVILAGGQSRRMGGGDKTLALLGGRPVLAHVLERLRPQADPVALSANGDPGRFEGFALPVLADEIAGLGPLGGLHAALGWARALGAAAVVTVPGDTPFLPADLVERLVEAARGGTGPAVAAGPDRLHPTCGLWPVALLGPLGRALAAGERRLGRFAVAEGAAEASFAEPAAFLNINTPADLAAAEAMAGAICPRADKW